MARNTKPLGLAQMAAMLESLERDLDFSNTTFSNVTLTNAVATAASGTIAGPGSFLGVSSAGQLVLTASAGSGRSGTVTAINNASANRLVTLGSTTTELDGEANLTYDGTTFVINDDAKVNDDLPLYFGTNSDAFIKYNEAGDNFLVISGSTNGIVLSGSTIQIDGILEGSSPLQIGGEVQFVSAGESSAFNFGPNNEAKIFYNDGDNTLVLSGSLAAGTVASGSCFVVDQKFGVGLRTDEVTHAITLPNNDDTTGAVKANAFVSYSSARYKEDIQVLDDPMSIIENISGVSFKWRDSGKQDYGFIAEDVGKVLPEIVSWESNKKDAQGMEYTKLISFLVEAAKKQKKEIETLNQEVTRISKLYSKKETLMLASVAFFIFLLAL